MGQPMRKMAPAVFDYSEYLAGDNHLREKTAACVSRLRAVRCSSGQIIIVSGSQQGLDLCARLLIDRGDEAGLENPGYQGARWAFSAHGARLRPLRIDVSGAVIRGLNRKTRLVYVTPLQQYPTGISMSLARRLELIEWAKHSGAVIVENDY
jgi:GntR family transcriptional regulator / MocR family aminotransferase